MPSSFVVSKSGPDHGTVADGAGLVRAVFEDGWNRQDFESVLGIFAEQFDFHIGGTSKTLDVGDLERIVATWHRGFSDFRFEIHTIVSSGDRAAVHATLTGTHDGLWRDLPPTGNTVRVEHMFFFRFERGRIAEVWELLDRGEFRRQLVGD